MGCSSFWVLKCIWRIKLTTYLMGMVMGNDVT